MAYKWGQSDIIIESIQQKMNKKSIHSFSDRFLPKNLKREQLCDNTKLREKRMSKGKVFT